MNEFVPSGYLPLKEALEYFRRRRETAKFSDIGPEELDHELENTEKASSKQEFRQLLFEETVSAKHFIVGRLLSLESSIWGRGEAEYIFASGWATIRGGNEYFPAEVSGRVLIKQSSIDALFDGDSDETRNEPAKPMPTADHRAVSTEETETRNADLQTAAEAAWRNDPHLTKAEVAKLISDQRNIPDNRSIEPKALEPDSIERRIFVPQWVHDERRRQKAKRDR